MWTGGIPFLAEAETNTAFLSVPSPVAEEHPVDPRAREILARLKKAYPGATCTLDFKNPLQLLVATMLSAQCTDERVNKVTPALFRRFPNASAFAEADRKELEELIRSTGFFRQKARSIQESCRILVEKFGGGVPDSLEELIQLPGVGRKTANVVLGNAFGKNEGVVVDTHVGRLARRLGLSDQTNPEKVEQDLMTLFPRREWTLVPHLFIQHGRAICTARNPNCSACFLRDLCVWNSREKATGKQGSPKK